MSLWWSLLLDSVLPISFTQYISYNSRIQKELFRVFCGKITKVHSITTYGCKRRRWVRHAVILLHTICCTASKIFWLVPIYFSYPVLFPTGVNKANQIMVPILKKKNKQINEILSNSNPSIKKNNNSDF